MVKRNIIIGTSDTSLTTANQSLDGQDISRIEVTLLLLGKEGLYFLSFPMVRPAWDNWWILAAIDEEKKAGAEWSFLG